MEKVAHELSEQLYGRDDQRTLALVEMGVDIISSSYNTAKSFDMGDISDGTRLEIEHYCDSCFEVAVFIDAFRDEDYTFSIVPVEQAIMISDSDVVFHSLKAAKHLNGKLGVIEAFTMNLADTLSSSRGPRRL